MATRNDYLLLEQKCLRHYQLALPYLQSKKGAQEFPKEMQARFGFYYFILKLYLIKIIKNNKKDDYRFKENSHFLLLE